MQETIFRSAPNPKFTLNQASLVALILLLSFFWLLDTTQVLNLQLAPEELARIEAERLKNREDLIFRFVEAPEEQSPPEDARFFSDADRLRRSAPVEQPVNENEDPTSVGNTFELTQSSVSPAIPPAFVPETQEVESRDDPPEEDVSDEPEPVEVESTPEGPSLSTDPSAPKPYRKPSEEEIALARKLAVEQLMASQNRDVVPKDARQQFDNPQGSRAQRLGFSIDTAGHDLGPYLKKLIQLVKGHWRIPEIARFEVSGVAVIAFNLHQDGTITETSVLETSQHEPLDMASFNAINTIHKAPPLPEHIEEPFIPIKFAFYYNMRPRY